jgi:hypothetical protein
MITKNQIIEELKAEYPTLKTGNEEDYVELSSEEYEATIEEWAEVRLAKEIKMAEAEAKEIAKLALYERLGITAEEAKLLLS